MIAVYGFIALAIAFQQNELKDDAFEIVNTDSTTQPQVLTTISTTASSKSEARMNYPTINNPFPYNKTIPSVITSQQISPNQRRVLEDLRNEFMNVVHELYMSSHVRPRFEDLPPSLKARYEELRLIVDSILN